MGRYDEIISRLLKTAQDSDDVYAAVTIGSSTRKTVKADEYSDLDVIIVTSEPESWLYGGRPEALGKIMINFTEPTLGGGTERRMLFYGNLDVDMIVFTPEQMLSAVKEGVAAWVMNRGYCVIYDNMKITALLQEYIRVQDKVVHTVMDEKEYVNTVNDFFFHVVWANKKLLRGETWSAKMCIDAYLKTHLRKIIESYVLSCDKNADVWHDGRFLDRWAGENIVGRLRECFGHYDKDDLTKALWNTEKLFAELAEKTAKNLGYAFPEKAAQYAEECLKTC